MSTVGTRGPDVFVRHPDHARLVCDMLADTAEATGKFRYKKAYQVLRSLTPAELFDMLTASQKGKDKFVIAFGPLFHREAGEEAVGPLFGGTE